MEGKLIVEAATMVVDTGTTLQMDAVSDSCVIDVRGMSNVAVWVNQLVDDGTSAISVEYTLDGTNYATLATLAATDFPAGANKSKVVPVEGANGMPLPALAIKLTLTANSATAAYTATAAGRKVNGYT